MEGTATTPGRRVDAGAVRSLRMSYRQLVKAGENSVRAAWRFGQNIDSHSDNYTQLELAGAMELSVSTLHRYLRLFRAYERPELAVQASRELETADIGILVELAGQMEPVEHRPLAGRRFRYRCRHCQSTDIGREEILDEEDEDEPAELTDDQRGMLEKLTGRPA